MVFLSLAVNLIAQEKFTNSQYGFTIDKPKGWIVKSNAELVENLLKYDLQDESLLKMIADHKGSILLTSFSKYDPQTHAGLIPTVQVNVRANGTKSFDQFMKLMTTSAEGFKNYFEDFSFATPPQKIEISGVESVYFIGTFTMPTQDGTGMKVRSMTYAIPHGSFFFQVNFSDGQEIEDSSEVFDKLVSSIVIGK